MTTPAEVRVPLLRRAKSMVGRIGSSALARLSKRLAFGKAATTRTWSQLRQWGSERAELTAVRLGAGLVRGGTSFLLFPHRSEVVELPIPLAIGGFTFDVIADLESYTGLNRSQVIALVQRRIETFRTEWHAFPAPIRQDLWYYRTSRLYLFANAVHIHDTPDLLELIVRSAQRGRRVLEFGGGTGNLSLALAAHGFEVDYSDVSAIQKDFVRFRAARHGLQDRVRILDDWDGLPRSTYGTICALDVLEHLPDLRSTLETQILAALAPRGVLIEQSPFVQGVSNPMHHLDEHGLDSILRAHGLEVTTEHPLGRVWQSAR